ncbi:MAG: hypothetical protein ACK5QX_02150, partial [bacterium]
MFTLLGDFVGQAATAGLIGPRSKFGPSRHTYASFTDLAWTQFDLEEPPPATRSIADVFSCYNIGNKVERDAALNKLGMKAMFSFFFFFLFFFFFFFNINNNQQQPNIPALLEIRWAAYDYFKRLGICYMHLCLEGYWRRHSHYLFSVLTEKERLEVNKRVAVATHNYPTLRPLLSIVSVVSSRTTDTTIKLTTYTAEQIETWVQVMALCLEDFLEEVEISCLRDHLTADMLTIVPEQTEQSLETLGILIDESRLSFRATLCDENLNKVQKKEKKEERKKKKKKREKKEKERGKEHEKEKGKEKEKEKDKEREKAKAKKRAKEK